MLVELPKVEKFLGRRKKVGPGAGSRSIGVAPRVRAAARPWCVVLVEKRTNEFGKDV